jgi:signal transduction histidine kinase
MRRAPQRGFTVVGSGCGPPIWTSPLMLRFRSSGPLSLAGVSRLRHWLTYGLSLILLGAIVLLDTYIEPEISLTVFYILPVVVAVWYGSRAAGIALSLLSSGLWLAIELSERSYHQPWTPYWEASGRAATYVTVALIISTLRRSLGQQEVQAGLIRQLNASLEKRVEERTRELKKTLEDLEAFTYTMAHDLRAPLRALHGFSDILGEELDGVLSASDKDYLSRIGEAARRMDRLVLDLLDFAHLIHYPVQTQEIDAEGLLRTVQGSLEEELKPATADVRVEGPIPRVRGEVGLVTEVLRKLLSNALRSTEEGKDRRIHVRIRAERRAEWVRISVEDDGPEIPVGHHERVFEPGERWRPGDATGMGLAIVRKAVERMDGHVGVESAPEGGSRFWFELRAA